MRRSLGAFLLALLLTAAAFVAAAARPAPASASAVTIGIAEQQPQFFTNSSFLRTRIGEARLLVGWNAVEVNWQRAQLDQWMAAAGAAGVRPLVTFGTSRSDADNIPTPERFRRAVNTFRARYPWVTQFSTWNEANACGSRMCRRPKTVAAYWRQLRLACPGCTVLAADLVDAPNIPSWVRDFRRAASTPPTRWGLHNYLDANRYTTTFTRMTLSAIGGNARLWLTETGGLVDRNNHSTIKIPQGFQHAANATGFIFDDLRRVSSRVQRIYFYNMIAGPAGFSWDSAFLSRNLDERRSYRVLRDRLSRLANAGLLTGRRPAS